ncbi:unnamed protein product [Blepharisma stoltei]|uniref:Uncharacterized protein n=1 Tax=Blepharisma stoltei TaxID=1481888 RepID=A0AAU9IEC5_9CILI|nr:unnamed protein product [Blepharisma stoltei]
MDVFLIVLTIIIAIILLACNFYFMIYYLDPSEKGFADSMISKLILLSGLMLAWAQVLALPLDVSNSSGDGGDLRIDIMWEIIYMAIFAFLLAILPFAMFFSETDDEKQMCERICDTLKTVVFLWIIELLVLLLMYFYLSYTEIPVVTYTCLWTEADNINQKCDQGNTNLEFNVSFPIYVMAFMSWFGWWFLVLFGGIGLAAIPLDFINKFRFRPQRLSPTELIAKERSLRARTKNLLEMGGQVKIAKSQVSAETSWLARRKLKEIVRRDTNQLQKETLLLEQDYEIYLVEKGIAKQSPLWYPFFLCMGVLSLFVSILWILQIIIYILAKNNGAASTPFLNEVLIKLSSPGVSFLGTTIYCLFSMYLLLACIKGNVKFGLRIPYFFRAYPIKKDKTPMNAMFFNVSLVLICSVAVTLFATNAFSMYTRLTDIGNMFGIQVRYLEFFKYFYDNNVFEYMLVIWTGLAAIYFAFKNQDKPKTYDKFDMDFEKEKLRSIEKSRDK